MSVQVSGTFIQIRETSGLSTIQKFILMKFHPTKIFIDATAGIWSVYFLWLQKWELAVGTIIVSGIISNYCVRKMDFDKMAETTLGKLALLHLHPVNLTVQILGAIPLIAGLWLHDVQYILIGSSAILLGHTFGWAKVKSGFSLK